MTDDEILERWKPILNYSGENCAVLPEDMYMVCANALNAIETSAIRLLKKDNAMRVLKFLIPTIRKKFSNSNKNRLDDCWFDIKKSHISDEYVIVLDDIKLNKRATFPVSLVHIWVTSEDLAETLSQLQFKDIPTYEQHDI